MINRILDIIFPRRCCVCGTTLTADERHLCIGCMSSLPVTNMHTVEFNRIEQMFAGQVPINRATSLIYYHKAGHYAAILHDLKYHNTPEIGSWLAECLSRRMLDSGFFNDIDMIIPIPLHRMKQAQRGYNQSEYIARGISKATGIPVDTVSLHTLYYHSTQTHKHRQERWENMQGIFEIKNASRLAGLQILLVDDVITTGATLISAALTIKHASPSTQISILTLALAND